MTTDIDLSDEFGDDFDENFDDGFGAHSAANILPPVEELYGNDAVVADIDLDSMIATAVDPETPAPEGDLVPDSLGEDPVADDALFGDDEALLFDDHSLDSTFANHDVYGTYDTSDEVPPLDADVELNDGSSDVNTEGGF